MQTQSEPVALRTPTDFAALVHPYTVPQFMQEVWNRAPRFTEARSGVAERVFESLRASTVPGFLKLAAESVLVMQYSSTGQYRATPISAAVATDFIECGSTLYFHLRPTLAPVNACVREIAAELGVDPEFIKLSIFASPAGATTEWHFDANENFTIHLVGAKRWLVSGASVVNPMGRISKTSACPPELAPKISRDLEWVSQDHITVHMQPGAVLYVPRGAWHRVDALEDAIALNVCITPQTWEQVVLAALRRRLQADPVWREMALEVKGTREPSPQLQERYRENLARLVRAAGDLSLDELRAGG